jgi:uncharacterized damage-inducible protein DinB
MNDENKEISFRSMLLKQFERKWKMLREAIENCPDDKWHEGKDDWIFSNITYHIVETADFYTQEDYEKMNWGRVSGIDLDKDSKEEIKEKMTKITKELVSNYLEEMDTTIIKLLKKTSDKDLLKKDSFYWFDSIYEKLIYLLRHNSYHLGELTYMLRECNAERLKWK